MKRFIWLTLMVPLLSGCITLLPKAAPVQLYQFGATGPTVAPAAGRKVALTRTGGTFARASAGDKILTIFGNQVAYLAQARWVAPATTLFDEAVNQGFNASSGPARLASRVEPAHPAYALRLDVEQFAVVYDRGTKAAPKVVIATHLVLSQIEARSVVLETTVRVEQRSSDNRVGSIVAAFDQASGEVIGEIVERCNQSVAAS